MKKNTTSQFGFFNLRISFAFALCSAAALLAMFSFAASPSSATITPGMTTPFTWLGTAPGGSSASETTCVDGVNCDTFTLTLSGTQSDWIGKKAHVAVKWDDPDALWDYDVYVHKGPLSGPVIKKSAGSDNPEAVDLDPNDAAVAVGTGTFTVHVVYFAANAAAQYTEYQDIMKKSPPPQSGLLSVRISTAIEPPSALFRI